nr:hypothetical protein [Tanacetum cinerariifolium]
MIYDLGALYASVKTLTKQMWDMFRVESSPFKRLEKNDMRMDSFDDDMTILDSAKREQIQEMKKLMAEINERDNAVCADAASDRGGKGVNTTAVVKDVGEEKGYYDDPRGWEYIIKNQLPLKRRCRERPYDPSTNTTSRPRRNDPYVMVRDNAVRANAASDRGGKGVNTTAVVKDVRDEKDDGCFTSVVDVISVVEWKSIIKRYIDTKPNHELIHCCLENPPYELGWKDKEVPTSEGSLVTRTERVNETYKNVSQDIIDQLNAEAEAVQIILTGIDNDIYSTVDACLKACEMWKAIKRAKKIARVANSLALIAQQHPVYHPQTHPTHYTQNYSTRSQQAATRNRGKATVNTPQPIYDQEPSMVDEDDETSKDKEIDKLMDLISLSFKKIYKPTNNNPRTSSNTSRANQDNSLRINRNAGYENQRIGNVAGARETIGSTVVQKFRIQCYNCKEFGRD